MNHSTDAFDTWVLPDSGFVFEVGSVYERLDGLADARDRRGKRYALALVLLLIILAKLSGEDEPQGIAAWVRLRQSALIELLPIERETLPCANTYRNVARDAVEPEALQMVISEFLQTQAPAARQLLICIDGKTLRGTLNAANRSGVHLLAAYVPDQGLVLMQLAVDAKTNEISVAPQLLKCIDLRGKIVMGDALHTSSCAACDARLHANACGTGHTRVVHPDRGRGRRLCLVCQGQSSPAASRYCSTVSTGSVWRRLESAADGFSERASDGR